MCMYFSLLTSAYIMPPSQLLKSCLALTCCCSATSVKTGSLTVPGSSPIPIFVGDEFHGVEREAVTHQVRDIAARDARFLRDAAQKIQIEFLGHLRALRLAVQVRFFTALITDIMDPVLHDAEDVHARIQTVINEIFAVIDRIRVRFGNNYYRDASE